MRRACKQPCFMIDFMIDFSDSYPFFAKIDHMPVPSTKEGKNYCIS